MKKTLPLAIFDIDGTIFRSSLLIELQLALVKYNLFPAIVEKELEGVYLSWLNRKGNYDTFINEVVKSYKKHIRGCNEDDIRETAKLVIKDHKERVYRYTRDLIRKLRSRYFLMAISGSPIEIVKEFNRYWRFQHVFGTVYERNAERIYTGKVLNAPSNDKKEALLSYVKTHSLTLRGSIGVGDSESDIRFLELVDKPVAFNPNSKLYAHARKSGWHIVVERKDVIYHIKR